MSTPDAHLDAARKRLCHLSGLRQKTNRADQAIASAATEELAWLQEALPRLAARANLDPAAAEAYQRGILDRGRLQQVLAHSEPRVPR